MIHPFHPLAGQRLEFVKRRKNWSADRVYVYDLEGKLVTLPVEWTDVEVPDPFLVVAAGRSPFHIATLLVLADLVEQLIAAPPAVSHERFVASDFFDPRDLAQVKYEMVRTMEAEGSTVMVAARSFGFSRQSFYAAADALAEHGIAGLVPTKPGPRRAHKLNDEVLDHLDALRLADPSVRSSELAAAVAERFGISVHPRSVERALARREVARRPKSG